MSDETIQQDNGELDAAQAETVTEEVTQEESATSEEAEQESQDDEPEQPEEPPKPRGVQKRISELTANWRSAERDRDYWRDLAVGKKEQPQAAKPPTDSPAEFPTLESVGYDEGKYHQAVAEWSRANVKSVLTEEKTAAEQQRAQEQVRQSISDFYSRGSKVASDFHDVVGDESLPVTEAMRDALLNIDKGPEVLYHLAQNPDEMFRVANLNPYAQAAEIGRLEVRLSIPKPSKSSSAPPPVKPLSAGGESVSKNPDDMTPDEWLVWRRKQLS